MLSGKRLLQNGTACGWRLPWPSGDMQGLRSPILVQACSDRARPLRCPLSCHGSRPEPCMWGRIKSLLINSCKISSGFVECYRSSLANGLLHWWSGQRRNGKRCCSLGNSYTKSDCLSLLNPLYFLPALVVRRWAQRSYPLRTMVQQG